MSQVLIVDDEEAVCWALRRALQRVGHQVQVAASAETALKLAQEHHFDAVVLDVRLPGMDGLSALGRLRERTGGAPVILITAFGNLSTAVQAVEGGAFEYLTKPFDLDQALAAISRALERRPVAEPPPVGLNLPVPEEIVGRSPAMQAVFKRIALVAPHDACVLITGESGTGKELVARALHRHSPRRDRPFLPIHVAALSPSLVESELFGHVKGAFTGAGESRPGLLQLADGGTVFLDELADIPLQVQVKLLRVLEHNEVLPVGGNVPQPLHVRILSATHQNLSEKVAEGTFRHDLFFRLNVFGIDLPPLRERPEDIGPLAEYFLRRFAPTALPLLPETTAFLTAQDWPGNVRELRNALEHAAILARGEALRPEHFPRPPMKPAPVDGAEQVRQSVQHWLAERLRQAEPHAPANLHADLMNCVEPVLLEEVMRRVQDNRWVASQWLGLNRATVRKKLERFHLPSFRPTLPPSGGNE